MPTPTDGNRYVFSASGSAPRLAFRAMGLPGIVLFGAGMAWLLGLVLVMWPATRHVLTLLTAAFLFSLLGVFYAAPMQVLLQPAVLGVALAALMAAINGYLKRRTRPVSVTLSSPGGFTTPSSSHQRGPAAAVGSNEFTSIRPAAPEVPRPAEQLSESGNRL